MTFATPAARRIAVWAVAVSAAAGLAHWPPAAHADTAAIRIRSLDVTGSATGAPPSATPAAAEPIRFDAGTRTVYARFSYTEASGQEVRLLVQGRGGVVAFSHTARYTGDGTATVPIDGTAVYAVLTGGLEADARDAKQSAKQAAERSIGVQEFLRAAGAAVLRLQWTVDLLDGMALPPSQAAAVDGVDSRLRNAGDILGRAIELPPDDVAGKQRRAAQVDTMLGEVVSAAGALAAEAADQRDLPLPESGHRATDAFVVQLEIDGDIAASTEFWVWGPARIQLPWLGKGAVIRAR